MSPWRMMEEWGVPTFYLQSMAYECAKRLATRGEWTPDLAMAGGFSTEDHIFKVLAMGAPYFKAVCMGRAMMIPGFVGSNIEGVVGDGRPPGLWKELPTRSRGSGRPRRRSSSPTPPSRTGTAIKIDTIPLGRRGHLHVRRQAADGTDPVHGRRPELPPRHAGPSDVVALTKRRPRSPASSM